MSQNQPDYTWLISRRSRIQEILLAQYDLIEADESRLALESDPTKRQVFGLLMGAAFSLWRAAFLSHAEHTWPPILLHAKKFLEILLRDNAINYPQDRDTRDWTAGYYLNNARFRLLRAYEVLTIDNKEQTSSASAMLVLLDRQGLGSQSRQDSWDTLCEALLELLHRLQQPTRPTAQG